MLADEIHKGERVFRVGDGAGVVAEGQPADAAVVELDKLAVGLLALVLAQRERPFGAGRQGGLLFQVVEIRGRSMRSGTVGSAVRFDLQDPKIDAHLDNVPAIAGLHHARLDYAGLEFPSLQRSVDILVHDEFPKSSRQTAGELSRPRAASFSPYSILYR